MGCTQNGAMQGPVLASPGTAARPPSSTSRACHFPLHTPPLPSHAYLTLLKVSMHGSA